MLIQTKIQIEPENHEFIKRACKELKYRSLSEYVREAISAKVREDRKRLRELKRAAAMEMMGKGPHDNHFESIEGDDFENR